MGQFIITYPDGQAARILAAFVARYAYDGPDTNPAKLAFVKQKIQGFILQAVKDQEIAVAQQAAGVKVDNEIPLT